MWRRADMSELSHIIRRVDSAADGEPSPDTIPTGFPSVDRLLGGGFRRGDLIVLGGAVGSGKSALSLAMALRGAQEGRVTAFVSGEMSNDRVLERALAIEGRARVDDIRRGALDEATRASVGAAAVRIRDALPHVGTVPMGGVDPLAEELRRTLDLELAVVDPLQSLAAGGRELDEEVASAARRLKLLAMDMSIALIVTTNLPSLSGDRPDPRPQLADFGALGAIEQHADIVLGLFREDMYQSGHGIEGATEMHVLKNRNGATGYVDLYFYQQWMRFEDMLDPDR
jgi:replicative DNA helicase